MDTISLVKQVNALNVIHRAQLAKMKLTTVIHVLLGTMMLAPRNAINVIETAELV